MQDRTSIEKHYTIDTGILPAISASFTPATTLELQGLDGKGRIRVHSSGKVELIDCSDVDEAARIFWNSVERMGLKLTVPEAAPAAVAVPDGLKLVPVDLTPEMKREFMDLLMDGIDIYVNRRDQIEIQTDAPRRIWKAVLALAPSAPADALATATGLPAQAVPLKLIEAINTACGGNEWQGEALAPDLLEPACRAVSSLAPRAQEDARLRLVRQAVRDFHYALDNRKHGGVAAGAAMNAIELALNMYWQQGQEADRRANQAAQGGE